MEKKLIPDTEVPDQFIQKHLDHAVLHLALQGVRELYITCFPSDKLAYNIPNTNKWIRKIDIHNIQSFFKRYDPDSSNSTIPS